MNPLVTLTALVAAASATEMPVISMADKDMKVLSYNNWWGAPMTYNNWAAAPYNTWAAAPYYNNWAAAPVAYNNWAAAPYNTWAAAPYNTWAAAAPVAAAPIAAPVAPSSQYQAQDEFGNLNYGYANINSAKQEVGNTYNGVTGKYSYVDANGELQTTEYIADAFGFRAKSTNLPVAPAVPEYPELKAPVFDLEAPMPVQETAEVMAARAEFMAKFEEAKREKRETPASTERLEKVEMEIKPIKYTTAFPYTTALPYASTMMPYNFGYNNLAYNNFYGYNNLNSFYPYATGYPWARSILA